MNRWQAPRGGLAFGGMGITPGVKLLLIANAVVFMLQTLAGGGLTGRMGPVDQRLAFRPEEAIYGLQVWRFFTYMFLHSGFTHILFNMFGLWMFGSQIEALWGRRSFLVYYLICGLGGAVLYGIFNLSGIGAITYMLGASGAVFGILLAYGLTFPDNVILVMFVLPMKAKYFVLLYGLMELMAIPGGGGVAHLAHLGGMLSGFLFLRLTAPAIARGPGLGGLGRTWRRWRAQQKFRVVPPASKPPAGGNGKAPRSANQEQVDLILDKISREGLQSLSEEEQEILRRAGRK